MWARVIEFMLACWLASSPFIFKHPPERVALWANELITAVAVASFSLLSFSPRLERMHLLNILVGGWLIGSGYFRDPSMAPAGQNHITVGLLLLMLAVIPSRAGLPPRSWREFQEQQGHGT